MGIELRIGLDAINSYKRLDYTPWHAIAEFVDNSTQSYFDHRDELDKLYAATSDKLQVAIVYDKDSMELRVSDNAMGMSIDELQHALHIAHPPQNPKGRSRYGMGLKTAACWIGNYWTIRTKRLGETVEHSVIVDVEQIASGQNELPYTSIDGKSMDDHYTVLEIYKHNRIFHGRRLGKIGQFLKSMYREDFRQGLLDLQWQGATLDWPEMDEKFFTARDGSTHKKSFEFTVNGKDVHGWVGILGEGYGSRADAGFTIIHSGRVIEGWPEAWRPESLYGQVQGSNDLVNQRLVGEIHLDAFEVSHTKDSILWLGDEEDEVQDRLREHCTDYRDIARKSWKGQKDSRGPSEIETRIAVDEFQKELTSPELIDQIQLEPIIPEQYVIDSTVKKITDTVVATHAESFRSDVTALGMRIKGYIVGDMSPNDPYVVTQATQPSEVIVIINTLHPHWSQLKGSEGVLNYLRHCTYDAIAEWQARLKTSPLNPDTIKLLKDRLLRINLEIEMHDSGYESEEASY